MDEYLPMFLAEGREHLQELNLAVVQIEETPDDHDTVDEIFRIAHSLKGMSATMGFAGMAALTHEMEDVFELLRQRRAASSVIAIDVLSASTRCRRRSSRSPPTGDEDIHPQPLIESLQGLVRDRTPGSRPTSPGRPAAARAGRAGRRPARGPDLRAPGRRRLDARRAPTWCSR